MAFTQFQIFESQLANSRAQLNPIPEMLFWKHSLSSTCHRRPKEKQGGDGNSTSTKLELSRCTVENFRSQAPCSLSLRSSWLCFVVWFFSTGVEGPWLLFHAYMANASQPTNQPTGLTERESKIAKNVCRELPLLTFGGIRQQTEEKWVEKLFGLGFCGGSECLTTLLKYLERKPVLDVQGRACDGSKISDVRI